MFQVNSLFFRGISRDKNPPMTRVPLILILIVALELQNLTPVLSKKSVPSLGSRIAKDFFFFFSLNFWLLKVKFRIGQTRRPKIVFQLRTP